MDKTINVQYYAILREERGVGAEAVSTAAATPDDLYRELKERHGFTLRQDQLKVAVNESFSAWDANLKDGDTIVFVPPVAGG
jgi:molybdopterin converting factor small subunit